MYLHTQVFNITNVVRSLWQVLVINSIGNPIPKNFEKWIHFISLDQRHPNITGEWSYIFYINEMQDIFT